MISRKRLYTKVVQWTARNITQQYQVYILAVGVGLASGLAAVILKNTVHYTHYLLSDGFNYEEKNYLLLFQKKKKALMRSFLSDPDLLIN